MVRLHSIVLKGSVAAVYTTGYGLGFDKGYINFRERRESDEGRVDKRHRRSDQ